MENASSPPADPPMPTIGNGNLFAAFVDLAEFLFDFGVDFTDVPALFFRTGFFLELFFLRGLLLPTLFFPLLMLAYDSQFERNAQGKVRN